MTEEYPVMEDMGVDELFCVACDRGAFMNKKIQYIYEHNGVDNPNIGWTTTFGPVLVLCFF